MVPIIDAALPTAAHINRGVAPQNGMHLLNKRNRPFGMLMLMELAM